MPIIGLDPGHGGNDPGALGVGGVRESDLTLELSLMVRDRLTAQEGFSVVMTRTTDTNPGDVSERGRILAAKGCGFGLSLHFNDGAGVASAKGTEIYIPFAETTGAIEGRMMPDLVKLFPGRASVYKSRQYATQNYFDKKIDLKTYKFGYVSKLTDHYGFIRAAWAGGLSADLLEVCFITNPGDMATYQANKNKVADIIARAIVEGYGKTYVPLPAAPAPAPEPEEPTADEIERLEKLLAASISETNKQILRAEKAEGKLAQIYTLYEKLKEV